MKRLILAILFSLFLSSQTWAGDRVGYWNMDEASGNLTDLSGHGMTLTANGSPSYQQTGAPNRGKAILFNGTNAYFRSTSIFNDAQGTVSAWINISALPGTRYGLTSADEATTNYYISPLRIDSTYKMSFIIYNNGSPYNTILGSSILQINQWYHIVVLSTGAEYKIYVNGSLESLTVQQGLNNGAWFSSVSNRDNTVIGALRRTSTSFYFSGLIDDVKIYNYALSAIQIQHEYQQSRLATQLKYEPWKFMDLFKLTFFRGDQLDEKDNRISYLRQRITN